MDFFWKLVTVVDEMRKFFRYNLKLIIPSLGLLTVLILIPLAMVMAKSIFPDNQLDLLAPLRALVERNLSEVALNSIRLGFWVVVGSTFVAFPVAFLTAKTWLYRYKWLDLLLLIPFMTPPYICSMGWILFMQPRGYLEQLCPGLARLSSGFFSFAGLIMIMSLHSFPFIYLALKNTLMQIGGSLEEAGAVHGGGFWYRLRKIVIPLTVSSYGAGALLVFIRTISEFGTPATMGRRIGFYVLTTEIHRLTTNWPINFGKASGLSTILLGICLLLWYVQNRVRLRFSYPLTGPKGSRAKFYSPGLPGKLLIWGYLGSVLLVAVGIPYFAVIMTSVLKLQGYGLTLGNFTLDHYRDLLAWGSRGLNALVVSLGLALTTATIAGVLGTFLALAITTGESRLHRLVDFFALLPNTVPNIVMIVGLILYWNAPWMSLKIYNTCWMVLVTYVVLFLPYTVQYVKTIRSELDQKLLQAAKIAGGRPVYVLRKIMLPLLLPGIISGWAMTFIISVRELVASLMILPPGMENAARYIFAQFDQGSNALGMAMAVVAMLSSTVVLLLIQRLLPARNGL
jgi:iron(III) transport system permease protein